jgi:hypothetical protein
MTLYAVEDDRKLMVRGTIDPGNWQLRFGATTVASRVVAVLLLAPCG